MIIGADDIPKEWFPYGLVPDICNLIKAAWEETKKPVPGEREERINARLCVKMRRKKSEYINNASVIIENEYGLIDEDTGKVTDSIDICLLSNGEEYVYLPLECKKLRIPRGDGKRVDSNADQYTKEGIVRFVNGKYLDHDMNTQAAMVGYVLDGKTLLAWKNIDNSIRSNAELILLDGTLSSSRFSKDVFETRHATTPQTKIYHLLLAC